MADQNIPPPASLPWFQFYYQDFLVGVSSLSMAETGAYITLLCFQWTNGSVPDDDGQRARLLRCSKRQAVAVWNGIRSKFHQGDDGAWRNLRLEAEREKQAQHRTNGAKGGSARSRGHSQPPSQSLAGGKPEPSQKLAEAKPEPSQSLAEGKPSESESESESERSKPRSALKGAPIFARATQNAQGNALEMRHTHPAQRHGLATLHRGGHRTHSWCSERICVPDFLHEKFTRALGGVTADQDLRALYLQTVEAIPDDQPIEPDPLKFWPPYVTARWPPASASVGTRTAALQRATAEFLRGGA